MHPAKTIQLFETLFFSVARFHTNLANVVGTQLGTLLVVTEASGQQFLTLLVDEALTYIRKDHYRRIGALSCFCCFIDINGLVSELIRHTGGGIIVVVFVIAIIFVR